MNRSTFDAMLAQYKAEQISGEGIVSWDKGAHCVIPEVQICGKVVQDGTPTPDAPIMPVFSEGTTVECGGSVAVAPIPLLAAVGGTYQSTWDPQTGKGLNWWYDVLELDGSDDEGWDVYEKTSAVWAGFRTRNGIIPRMDRNPTWCNQVQPSPKGGGVSGFRVWAGANNLSIYFVTYRPSGLPPYFDESLEDYGLSNWITHLKENPIKLWIARNEPVPFETAPQPLIQPHGAGNIIQIGGTVDSCPIIARPVTHR